MAEITAGEVGELDPFQPEQGALRGRMGVGGLLFAVLAYNAPAGVFAAFLGVVIGYGNGLGAPLTFVVAGAILALFAVGFTTMGLHLPRPGAFYAYITAGLGRMPGLAGSFVAVVAYNLILLGNYLFFGVAAQSLVANTFNGPTLPWWFFVFVSMALVGLIGYLNVDVSAKFLGVILVVELVAIGLYDFVVIARGGAEGISGSSFTWDSFTSGSVGLALLFAMTMFGGFEATAIFREEVRDPSRTIPRATYLAVAVITFIYAVSIWAIILAIGPSNAVAATAADPTGSVLGSVEAYLGVFGRDALTVLVLTSNLACTLASHNISSRYVYSLSFDGILPKRLANVHGRHGSPHRASMAESVLMLAAFLVLVALVGNDPTLYATVIGLGGYAILVLILATAVAVLVYLRRNRFEGVTLWQSTISTVAAIAALVVVIYLATTNLDLLIGGSQTKANLCLLVLAAVIAIGVAFAAYLKQARPEIYQRIGRQG